MSGQKTLLARTGTDFLNRESDGARLGNACWADDDTVLFTAELYPGDDVRLLATDTDGNGLWDVTPEGISLRFPDLRCANGYVAMNTSRMAVTLYTITPGEPGTRIRLPLADYPPRDTLYRVAAGDFWLVHTPEGDLFAFAPVSPEYRDDVAIEACRYDWNDAVGRFVDPCSGDEWDLDGTLNLEHSTQRWSNRDLDQYAISIEEGTITVYLDRVTPGASTPENLSDTLRGRVEMYEGPQGQTITFPKQPPTAAYMEAEVRGTLILDDNGCLRVASEWAEEAYLVIWHHDFTLRIEEGGAGNHIAMLNDAGEVVARVGQPLRGGGGYLEGGRNPAIPGLLIEACPGPYIILGSLPSREIQAIPDIFTYPFGLDDPASAGLLLAQSKPAPEEGAIRGALTLESRCLRVDGYTVLWPPDVYPDEDAEPVQIVYRPPGQRAQMVAVLGEEVTFAGSERQPSDYRFFENKVNCPGPYWGFATIAPEDRRRVRQFPRKLRLHSGGVGLAPGSFRGNDHGDRTMKQNTRLSTLVIPLAGLLALVIAAALDYGLFQLRLYGSRTFNVWRILWAFSVADLVLAVLFLAVAWLTLHMLRLSWLSGVLLFLPGLPIAFYLVLRRIRLARGGRCRSPLPRRTEAHRGERADLDVQPHAVAASP